MGTFHRLNIEYGENRLDAIVSSVMNNNRFFEDVDSVLVQGDTTSAFAVALAAFHRKIKIIHLEAGLRTFNKDHPYPEEFNRRAISCMADIHLSPTEGTLLPFQVFHSGNGKKRGGSIVREKVPICQGCVPIPGYPFRYFHLIQL